MKDRRFAFVALIIAVCTGIAFKLINDEVPEPYMDEHFHVKQTQQYCSGAFQEWDPKITTFPGLYFIATVLGWATRRCDLTALRFVNAAFTVACFPLFYFLALTLNTSEQPTAALIIKASACCLFPVHFFHGLLYYTDTVSVFFVFLALLAGLRGWRGTRFIASLLSIAMRQTNAVWVGFILGCGIFKEIDPSLIFGDRGDRKKRKMKEEGYSSQRQQQQDHQQQQVSFIEPIKNIMTSIWNDKYSLIVTKSWEIIALLVSFATFVIWNGGVVIGDKSHHTLSLHLMQPIYLIAYIAAALAPLCFSTGSISNTLKMAIKHPGMYIMTAAVMMTMVYNFTLIHPFMVADNRHIVFYIWRRVLNYRWWSRYALIPFYLHSATALLKAVVAREGGRMDGGGGGGGSRREKMEHSSSQRLPLLLLWWLCSAVVLVPSKLVEFRYFTVPTLIAFLMLMVDGREVGKEGGDRMRRMRMTSSAAVAVVVGWAVVDIITVWLFLNKPFMWGDGSIARFVW